jgi:glutathione S-transferase
MHPKPILHHFDLSPFAEKIRLVLGFKKADWLSVKIPMVMPKPDVIALTGGHRRTPLLQIGADVWCDTALIARVLDHQLGGTSLHPADVPLAPLMAQWADWTLFWHVVDFCSQPACAEHRFAHMSPQERAAVAADRSAFRAPVPRLTPHDAGASLQQYLNRLQAQLGYGGEFLLGPVTIADFSVAHCLWHLRRGGPPAERLLAPFTHLMHWHDRMLGFGHGNAEDLASADALTLAAQTKVLQPARFDPEDGLKPGQAVRVAAADYGTEPSTGNLIGITQHEVVIQRTEPRAGQVHVHFPRAGFQVVPLDA